MWVREKESEVKQMNTIGIALISFGIGLIISLKLMKEDEKKRKRGKRDV